MMITWSDHTGAQDRGGDGAVRYLQGASVLKQLPDGSYQREERDPPPEILRGHPDIVRRAINSLTAQHVYSSGVMSFAEGDLDVAAFNAGDPGLRTTVDKLIDQFEELMFAGIPMAMRPPCFWTTHTHTGRLELNFLTPRAVQSGKVAKPTKAGGPDRPIRAYNPHPPGKASRRMYDAFRRIWNAHEGWADPEDPARAQAVRLPDHVIKAQRAAERSGVAVEDAVPPAPVPEDPRAAVHAVVSDWVRAGSVTNRDELLSALKAAGYQIKRAGAAYISILSESAAHPDQRLPHLPKAIRLKGALYGEGFTDRAQALDWLAPVDTRPAQPPEAAAAWCDPEADLALLRELRAQKRDFNRSRYGGPGWKPAPFIDNPPETALDKPHSYDARDQAEMAPEAPATSAPLSYASQVKARIWESLYQTALPSDLVDRIRFVDGKARKVRFRDGSVVTDHGSHISGKGDSATLAEMMALEAKAKGWSHVVVTGREAFLRAAARESFAKGLIPLGRTPKAEAIIAEEWAKLGGPARRKPAKPAAPAVPRKANPRPEARSASVARGEVRRPARGEPPLKGMPAPDVGAPPAPPPEPGTKPPPPLVSPSEPPDDAPEPGM